MTTKAILRYPEAEAALRQKSEKVGKIDTAITDLVGDLIETLAAQPGAGLAAPQIGAHQRLIVVRFGQDEGPKDEKHKKELDEPLALINPEIIKAGQPATGFDGCLSIPGLLTWSTVRPSVVTFKALTVEGKPIRRTVKGIDARLLHHEVDHLDGVLFLDRLESPDDLFIVKEGEDGKPYLVPFSKKPPKVPGTLNIDELKL